MRSPGASKPTKANCTPPRAAHVRLRSLRGGLRAGHHRRPQRHGRPGNAKCLFWSHKAAWRHPRHPNETSNMALGDRRSERITAESPPGCARGRHPRLGLAVRCGDLTLSQKKHAFFVLGEIRRKIRPPGVKPVFLRRLGPYVTKEELESIYQKSESVTRIFFLEKATFLMCFSRKKRQADRRRRLRATITTKRHL